MSNEKRNLPASVHQRLLNKAHETGQAFNQLIQYYAIERLLYRLSISNHAERFVLKGALVFNAWGLANMRPTRDIDLLGHTQNQTDHIVKIFQDICKLDAEPDGLIFDAKQINAEHIQEDAEYEDIHVRLTAKLGKTRLPIRIDIGFADIITPEPTSLTYPTILDFPAPHLYGYPPETIIADKFQAMTILGMANSRMKDFYDIWVLATNFEFGGKTLENAIEQTFQNRNTDLPNERHIIFSDEFATQKGEQWEAFIRKIKKEDTVEMTQLANLLRGFLLPIVNASHQRVLFKKKWTGFWR